MPKRTVAYHPWLTEKLKDPHVAAAYVKAASQDSREMFLKALRNVAEANQMSRIAEIAGLQRESLYRMLAESGNPRLDSLWGILAAMGLRLDVAVIPSGAGKTSKIPSRSRGSGNK